MVVMKVGEKESLAYRRSKHVFPTPESPIMRSLICISYVAVWLMVCVFLRYVMFFWYFYRYLCVSLRDQISNCKGKSDRISDVIEMRGYAVFLD